MPAGRLWPARADRSTGSRRPFFPIRTARLPDRNPERPADPRPVTGTFRSGAFLNKCRNPPPTAPPSMQPRPGLNRTRPSIGYFGRRPILNFGRPPASENPDRVLPVPDPRGCRRPPGPTNHANELPIMPKRTGRAARTNRPRDQTNGPRRATKRTGCATERTGRRRSAARNCTQPMILNYGPCPRTQLLAPAASGRIRAKPGTSKRRERTAHDARTNWPNGANEQPRSAQTNWPRPPGSRVPPPTDGGPAVPESVDTTSISSRANGNHVKL